MLARDVDHCKIYLSWQKIDHSGIPFPNSIPLEQFTNSLWLLLWNISIDGMVGEDVFFVWGYECFLCREASIVF